MKSKAYTLVELLVTVAVIVLLLMMLTPSYRQAISLTRATLCRNNLCKISTAFGTLSGGARSTTVSGAVALPNADAWPMGPYSVCPAQELFICPEKEEFAHARPKNPMEGLRYVHWDRGYDIPFTECGLGKMFFGTRRGQDSRGEYIEVGLDDNSAVTAGYMDNDGHDGLLRIYFLADGQVIIKLMKYSCGETNCVLYNGKPLFPDTTYNDPTERHYGWLGPGTSKNGREIILAKGMQCSYGINARSGELEFGSKTVLLVDYDKLIVNLGDTGYPTLMSTAGKRHLGKVNVLRADGSVEACWPTSLDPLLDGTETWEP